MIRHILRWTIGLPLVSFFTFMLLCVMLITWMFKFDEELFGDARKDFGVAWRKYLYGN